MTGEEKDANGKVAKVTLPDGQVIELPLLHDASGARFLAVLQDIRKLHASTGICTFDPGFGSTASCQSTITYIDGAKGVLLYRGYSVAELADKGDFMDSTYLLLHGELPNSMEKQLFSQEITRHTLVHEQLITFYRGFKHDAHPMAIMVGVVGALAAFYPAAADIRDPIMRELSCTRIISKISTLAALAYKTSIGQPPIYPRNDLDYASNFLHMMFAIPSEPYKVQPEMARALEIILILHLDHEQNASTSTVRVAGSSQANPFACVASGIAALWGPAHGGANEAVLKMLEEIGSPENIPQALARAKDKSSGFRLMGFGHRVYKTHDPRAKVMQGVCRKVMALRGQESDPLLEVAMQLEQAALKDDYFVSRHLYPNVDFYSGIVLRALGIPVSMFTVLFAVARTVGWIAQWKEMSEEASGRISRPRQMYNGKMQRPFEEVGSRPGDSAPDDGAALDKRAPLAMRALSAKFSTSARH